MAEFFLNEFIVNFDVAIYEFVDKIMNPALNVIMTFITHLGDTPGIIWWVIAIPLLIPKKTRKLGLLVIAGLAVSTVINNLILKEIIDRPRPYDIDPQVWLDAGYKYEWPGLIKKSGSPSFPSGHTSTSIGAGFALLLGCRKKWLGLGIPAFILSLLIGFSRIYVHVHYPSDVVVGALVGIISGVIALIVVEKLVVSIIIPKIEEKLGKKIIQ